MKFRLSCHEQYYSGCGNSCIMYSLGLEGVFQSQKILFFFFYLCILFNLFPEVPQLYGGAVVLNCWSAHFGGWAHLLLVVVWHVYFFKLLIYVVVKYLLFTQALEKYFHSQPFDLCVTFFITVASKLLSSCPSVYAASTLNCTKFISIHPEVICLATPHTVTFHKT